MLLGFLFFLRFLVIVRVRVIGFGSRKKIKGVDVMLLLLFVDNIK